MGASGDISQNGVLDVANLIGSADGIIQLDNTSNQITAVGSLVRGGDLTLDDSVALTVNGPLTSGTLASNVAITVTGAGLTLAGDITTTGASNGIDLTAVGIMQSSGTLNAGAGTVTLNGGSGAITLAGNLTTTGGAISVAGTGITQSAGAINSGLGTITLSGNAAAVSLSGSLTSTTHRHIGHHDQRCDNAGTGNHHGCQRHPVGDRQRQDHAEWRSGPRRTDRHRWRSDSTRQQLERDYGPGPLSRGGDLTLDDTVALERQLAARMRGPSPIM